MQLHLQPFVLARDMKLQRVFAQRDAGAQHPARPLEPPPAPASPPQPYPPPDTPDPPGPILPPPVQPPPSPPPI
jgi:hypothetical protein